MLHKVEIPINQQSTGGVEFIQARIQILHSLGREAVDRWDAAGRPLPPPELGIMAISQTTEV